ncbi:hypothetical protein ACCO45_009180 [Purpureocillium lilacinum]
MKEWEKHRDEMVQLYQVHKLGRVMEIMTQRHNFHACRRSYMEHFSKWGVRKYNRNGGREVVVHNGSSRLPDEDDEDDATPEAVYGSGRYGNPSSSRVVPHEGGGDDGQQTLCIPYGNHHFTNNHDPYSPYQAAGAAAALEHHQQQQPHGHHLHHPQHPGQLEHDHSAIGQQDWGELANGSWPTSHGIGEYDTGLDVASQYLAADGSQIHDGLGQAPMIHHDRGAHQAHHPNHTNYRL